MRRFFLSLVLVAAGVAGGFVLTGRMATMSDSRAQPAAAAAAPASASPPAPAQTPAVAVGPDFTRVAAAAVQGVANISSLQVVRTPSSPFANDPFFRYFFGDDDAFGSRDRRSLSLGSGVVVSADGYIVTNNHVVGENVREITVSLPDKREVKGQVVGTDPATDIALLKIALKNLPVVPWGDSSQLKVGEWVLAIGSPFQLNQTVTAGIVSATGRQNVGIADYEDFIQTDAAINPGNSGGALINSRGELVGINTAIFSQSGGYQGVGFAVPSNLARHVIEDLRKYGEVQRGAVDFRVDSLTPELAEQVGAASTQGAIVTRMVRNSASYAAGLRPGDVIVKYNGKAIADPGQLNRFVADEKAGTTAALTIVREGRELEVKVPIVSASAAVRRRR
ncbi:MAG: trypsin-like peptidase domain-containing protein [Acidobacteria bacterium]|nr:trypsin-like peptidase domain-containing protein [Acidobacteriota bacterium]